MTVEFKEKDYPIPVNDRDALIQWLQSDKVDDDLDVKAAAVDTAGTLLARIIQGWHNDKEGRHVTVEVYKANDRDKQYERMYTAHVYDSGKITGYA
jgi:hypothetical protein